ncbi:MAG: hypothetical protein ACO1QB_01560 [Verrucomicrobiales bacterium]
MNNESHKDWFEALSDEAIQDALLEIERQFDAFSRQQSSMGSEIRKSLYHSLERLFWAKGKEQHRGTALWVLGKAIEEESFKLLVRLLRQVGSKLTGNDVYQGLIAIENFFEFAPQKTIIFKTILETENLKIEKLPMCDFRASEVLRRVKEHHLVGNDFPGS